jgi:uncharacterized protein
MAPWLRIVIALALYATLPAEGTIVISQVYGGGGNSGATYRNDFIELFNRGTNNVSVAGWSVQYASASGSTWQVTPLSGTIAPGGYYLIQEAAGAGGGAALPISDATGSIPISVSGGKIALLSNSIALAVSCPFGATNVADFVGYGSANCAETGPAEGHSNSTSIRRNFNGCMETENNGADFSETAVLPRNGASPTHRCDTPPDAHSISEVQGTSILSPLVDQFITTTTNIVTALRNNGFFFQTSGEAEDGDPLTSEGLFVLTGGVPNVSVGNGVVVSGTVIEFKPASDPASPTRTQINAANTVVVSLSNALPAAATITVDDLPPDGGMHLLERFEGMRVRVEQFAVTAPTEGFLNEPDATATSTGVFYGTPSDVPRPFREPGIGILETLPAQTPCCIPGFDENPELLRVDSNAQLGVSVLNVSTHTVISNFTGVLFYEARRYTLLRDPGTAAVVPFDSQRLLPLPVPDEVTIGTINLQRFYDNRDDTNVDDVVLTSNAYSNRLQKAALLIRDKLGTPDILGLAEIENLSVLTDLAAAASSNYSAHLIEGTDFGGIDVGFLVNTAKVSIIELRQEGKTNLFTFSGNPRVLHDRPPLMLRARVAEPFTTNNFDFTIIMNHLRSMIGIDDPTEGDFVRAKRRAQAEYIARFVQQLQSAGERVLVMGDFNAFEFNDGYADVIGTIAGLPAPANQVLLPSADLVNPNLNNLIHTLPPTSRYSYVFGGTPQAIDHALVTQNLLPRVTRFLYVRVNADSPEILRNAVDRPERVSDHDPALVYLRVGTMPRVAGLTRTPSEVILEGEGPPERQCHIERSSDLIMWQQIGSAVPDGTQRFLFRDLNPVSGAAFYRLRAADQN